MKLLIYSILILSSLNSFSNPFCFEVFNPEAFRKSLDYKVFGKKEFRGFRSSSYSENIKFIDSIKKNKAHDLTYLRLENNMVKKLNDHILKNKDHTYSLSISFQELFLENLKKYAPDIYKNLTPSYHDFKSLTLAFKGDVDTSLLQKVFNETSDTFQINVNKYARYYDIEIPYKHSDIKQWHTAAIGNNIEEISLATKLARSKRSREIFTYSSFKKEVDDMVRYKTQAWKEINSNIKMNNFIKQYQLNGKTVEALDITLVHTVRKSESLNGFIKDLHSIYKIDDKELASYVYHYVHTIDNLAASVLTPASKSLSLARTKGILYSVDIGEMGAEGLVETMKGINGLTSIDQILIESRKAFWRADKSLQKHYEKIHNAFAGEINPKAIQYGLTNSGDDAFFDFDRAISSMREKRKRLMIESNPENADQIMEYSNAIESFEKKWSSYRSSGFDAYVNRISKSDGAYRFRVTSLDPNYINTRSPIPRVGIDEIVQKAEAVEKSIRRQLQSGKNVGLDESKNIVIGVETSLSIEGQINHRLIVKNNSSVTNNELKDAVEEAYRIHVERLKAESTEGINPYAQVRIDLL